MNSLSSHKRTIISDLEKQNHLVYSESLELDLSKEADLGIFLDSIKDAHHEVMGCFAEAKADNFNLLKIDGLEGGEVFDTFAELSKKLQEFIVKTRGDMKETEVDLSEKLVDKIQNDYNDLVVLQDFIEGNYAKKREESIHKLNFDPEVANIIARADKMLSDVTDNNNVPDMALHQIIDLFENLKDAELNSSDKNILLKAYKDMESFILENESGWLPVSVVQSTSSKKEGQTESDKKEAVDTSDEDSKEVLTPKLKRKTMEISTDDEVRDISIDVAKKAEEVINMKTQKTINHVLVSKDIDSVERSIVGTVESGDPINDAVKEEVVPTKHFSQYERSQSLIGEYITDEVSLRRAKEQSSSLSLIERKIKNKISQIEDMTVDTFEKWLGEDKQSPFLYLKTKTLGEVLDLINDPDLRAVLSAENIKYETFLTWVDYLPEMTEVVGEELSMEFGELCTRWLFEVEVSKG